MKTSFVQRQQKISFVKQAFTQFLCEELSLIEVQAPLITDPREGVQDTLSGHEKAVKVSVSSLQTDYEVVHSLAKWKRQTLGKYGFEPGEGLVTQMKALRPDEERLSAVHSVFVDQWDWEQVLAPTHRTSAQLKTAASAVYTSLKRTLGAVKAQYGSQLELPESLFFISTEALLQKYPGLTPKQRERAITKEHKAVFLTGIGADLSDGQRHDVRAPDYDDWTTMDEQGQQGLNGDLLVWSDVLDDAIELSSMGIRVDATALLKQLELAGRQAAAQMPWHQALLQGALPASVGGGIGQSRVCMFLLEQPHIGYVQPSVWCEHTRQAHAELL
ncbi:aspartate--ammonia ligase [Aliidiomarina maris]|uniref:Aspartate--ammonia ligase n=1 Tax=Aliidiomarina maris TaxID=531312 RepID=A0A327X3P3_9GAMM|nr:aspartate--ammonia ligase [Aliidiomarina maris]RAK00822.1 aspartate-ammonia ligase [Aliidiomarina maris]RUO27189.1 aspartate--ammonia ligase [Aliidiomarina maris]